MMDNFYILFHNPLINLQAQTQSPNIFETGLWNNNPDSTILLYVLGILSIVIAAIIFASYQYNKWKEYNTFQDEMKSLGMETPTEETLTGMVKRMELNEPVKVLSSKRMFDEMSSREIMKVLSSPGSLTAKQKFINEVYQIRNKAYSTQWLDELKEKKAKAKQEQELPDWLINPADIEPRD